MNRSTTYLIMRLAKDSKSKLDLQEINSHVRTLTPNFKEDDVNEALIKMKKQSIESVSDVQDFVTNLYMPFGD